MLFSLPAPLIKHGQPGQSTCVEKWEEQKPAQTEEFCKLQGCVSSLSTYQPLLLAGLGTINHCLAPHFFLNTIQGHCWPGLTDPSAVSMRHILCSSRGEHKCLSWNSSNSGGDGTAIQRRLGNNKMLFFSPPCSAPGSDPQQSPFAAQLTKEHTFLACILYTRSPN